MTRCAWCDRPTTDPAAGATCPDCAAWLQRHTDAVERWARAMEAKRDAEDPHGLPGGPTRALPGEPSFCATGARTHRLTLHVREATQTRAGARHLVATCVPLGVVCTVDATGGRVTELFDRHAFDSTALRNPKETAFTRGHTTAAVGRAVRFGRYLPQPDAGWLWGEFALARTREADRLWSGLRAGSEVSVGMSNRSEGHWEQRDGLRVWHWDTVDLVHVAAVAHGAYQDFATVERMWTVEPAPVVTMRELQRIADRLRHDPVTGTRRPTMTDARTLRVRLHQDPRTAVEVPPEDLEYLERLLRRRRAA